MARHLITSATELNAARQVGTMVSHLRSALVVCCALLLSACAGHQNFRKPVPEESEGPTLTVATFNIRHGCGMEDFGNTSSDFFKKCTKHIAAIVAAIRSIDPDMVGLQEVDQYFISELAALLNMNFAFFTHNASGYGGWWGNAVLTKSRILESSTYSIGGPRGLNRSIVTATVRRSGTDVTMVSVHTHHQLDSDRSLLKLREHLVAMRGPILLVGDFNMSPFDPRWRVIRQSDASKSPQPASGTKRMFVDTAEIATSKRAAEARASTFATGSRLDYVLVEPEYFKVIDAGLAPAAHRSASDHYALYAKVELILAQ